MKLDLKKVNPLIRQALKEDIGKGDITTACAVTDEACGLALILNKQEGVLAGIEVCRQVFLSVDEELIAEAKMPDGTALEYGQVALTIQGRTKSILTAERTALNFIQHLSGVATATNNFVKAVEGTRARILDTRKTIPGLRYLEKYAVACGGGQNHRMGLYDMALIKDNHIEAAGGVSAAIEQVRQKNKKMKIEIEVQSLSQLEEAARLEPDIIMLDNMKPEAMAEACRIVFSLPARDAGKLKLEASGNVTIDNVRQIAECGVDYISVGAITHSAPALDFSLGLKSLG
ncbi:carboxylating nicotinate-nucleotide diphosphorylase [candidate division TA06 bacterium]|uniref:Probable nicotinate-nucleotide pyrophosphorylase [carboxylating] n=1 Tax=candidate division TA06 bacterium TaxID=2250710 RepID=A0A933MKZ5_UNCT6|nr:carboxylating nicotinate-nucleotide diphosphorylase [candidate division TA06 bacterium]